MSRIHFPNLSKSIMAIVAPWAVMLAILYFESELFGFDVPGGYYGHTTTNPILIFGFPILVALVLMPKDSYESIKHALGLAIDTLRGKAVAVTSILVGGSVGYILYFYISYKGSIIPFYILPISTVVNSQLTFISIFMIYLVVAVGEEFVSILWAKNGANWLGSRFGTSFYPALIIGHVMARGFWASLHYFSYRAYVTGLGSIPLFMWAWGMGMIFVAMAFGFGKTRDMLIGKSGISYMIYPAIAAHLVFDVALTIHLATIPF